MTTKVTGMMSTGTKGGDIPSASTLVIDTDGDFFDITGTTGITAMTVDAGRRFTLQFDGAVVLTHGSSLYLPGAVNFTTEANDSLDFIATAANTVRCTGYALKDGGSPVSGGLSTKVLGVSFNMTTASGTVDVTGAGFDPTALLFAVGTIANTHTLGIGVGDSAGGEKGITHVGFSSAPLFNDGSAQIFQLYTTSGSAYQIMTFTFISDGIRLANTKGGSPTGTATLSFMVAK